MTQQYFVLKHAGDRSTVRNFCCSYWHLILPLTSLTVSMWSSLKFHLIFFHCSRKINYCLNSRRLLMLSCRSEKLLIIAGESSSLVPGACSYPLLKSVPKKKTSPIPSRTNTCRFNHTPLILINHRLTTSTERETSDLQFTGLTGSARRFARSA